MPRKVNSRGQKFYFEVGIDLKIAIRMYKKIQTTDFKLAAGKYDSITGDPVFSSVRLKSKVDYGMRYGSYPVFCYR